MPSFLLALVAAAALATIAAFGLNVEPAASATATKSATSAEAEYTCPMHPEVKQKGPGKCPKCGMALVAK